MKKGTEKVLKSVKALKGQKLWKFTTNEPKTITEDMIYYVRGLTIPFLRCNEKEYEVTKIHFYNENGVVYSFRGMEFGDATKQVTAIFDQYFRLKRKEKFDGTLFILSKGKDYWKERYTCHLYIPVKYLEAIGYKVIEHVHPGFAEKYQVVTDIILRTPKFELRISSETKDYFSKRKADLIEAVKKAKTSKDFEKALKDIMGFYRVEARDLNP